MTLLFSQVDSVMVVIQLARDAHAEQVWKKTLQPAPCLTVVGAGTNASDYELHGCLLHAATGQLLPDALRGHVRQLQPNIEEAQAICPLQDIVITNIVWRMDGIYTRGSDGGSYTAQ